MSELTILTVGGVSIPGSSAITVVPSLKSPTPSSQSTEDVVKVSLSDKRKKVKVSRRATDRSLYVLVTVNKTTTVIVE